MIDALSSRCIETAVDPRQPDGSAEERDGGELLENLHPGTGARKNGRPRGLEAQYEIRRCKSERQRSEYREGDGSGLSERKADGCTHEWSGARSGDQGGENSSKEAAGVTLLLRKTTADAGEREAEVELSCKRKREEEQASSKHGNERRRLQLESPSRLTAAGTQRQQHRNNDPEGDQDAKRVDETMTSQTAAFFARRTAAAPAP